MLGLQNLQDCIPGQEYVMYHGVWFVILLHSAYATRSGQHCSSCTPNATHGSIHLKWVLLAIMHRCRYGSLEEQHSNKWAIMHHTTSLNKISPLATRKEIDISPLIGPCHESDASIVLPVFHCLVDHSHLIT